jgi:hypothetical protein
MLHSVHQMLHMGAPHGNFWVPGGVFVPGLEGGAFGPQWGPCTGPAWPVAGSVPWAPNWGFWACGPLILTATITFSSWGVDSLQFCRELSERIAIQ